MTIKIINKNKTMADVIETGNLPPGWDCKYDPRTGRYYFVNLFTKTTTWEDPRNRFRQFQMPMPHHISNDSISQQPVMHGSPYHVYPSSNSFYPAQAAFQNPPSGVPSLTNSPNLATKIQQIELSSSISKSNSNASHTPHTPRMGVTGRAIQETSFSTVIDTETTVAKINSMFPTVPETHIRMLLKKYMKSIFPKAEETLILDVLAGADNNVQIASQQLIKLGYDKKDQAGPPKVNQRKSLQEELHKKEEPIVLQPKMKTPEEKKKIKARLQAKYKDIAEKIIAMALESVDYSEDRAKQILNIVIQEDQDKSKENKGKKTVTIETPKHGTDENKENTKDQSEEIRQDNEDDIDSQTKADDDEDDEAVTVNDAIDSKSPTNDTKECTNINDYNNNDCTNHLTISNQTTSSSSSRQSHRAKAKIDHAKYSTFRNSSSEDELENLDKETMEIKTSLYRIKTNGPNGKLFKGPNDDLLLADYVTWNGANPDLQLGRHKLANGPNFSLRSDRKYIALGPSSDLCKGPKLGLAKGSMYSQINCAMKDVKCN